MTFLGRATSKQLGHLCVDGQFFTRKAQLAIGVVQQQHARRESARLRKCSDLKNLVTGGASNDRADDHVEPCMACEEGELPPERGENLDGRSVSYHASDTQAHMRPPGTVQLLY